MSDTMLLGVLRMPYNIALDTEIGRIQYYQRGLQAADEIEKQRAENERLRAELKENEKEIIKLRKALEPLAQRYLWPDDLGEDMARHIRSDVDWCEETNEDADDDVFIKRKFIRIARKALEGKP